MSRGFELDTSTGNADLAWMLVLLFFITTFIVARPMGLASQVSGGAGAAGKPIVITLAQGADEQPELSVLSSGPLSRPTEGSDIEAWLAGACAPAAGAEQPISVHLQCPDEASHLWCKQQLKRLSDQAVACVFRY